MVKQKCILVTGSSGFLGVAIVKELLEKGYYVIMTFKSKNSAKKIKSLFKKYNNHYCLFECDFLQKINQKKLVSFIKKKFKYLNGIVNNAYSGAVGSIDHIDEEDFVDSFNLNVLSPFYLIKNLKQQLIAGAKKFRRSSSVVNIASIYGILSPNYNFYRDSKFQNSINYGATKASLIQMTRYFSCNFSPRNIRFNSISPGPFPNVTKQLKIKLIKKYKMPMLRFGRPEEVAGPVEFLLSDKSSYINGANIIVDGGWSSW
jgi:NAD(P)-dependent dehydrogenase (short-subunit alcohol dehydrogenase family)